MRELGLEGLLALVEGGHGSTLSCSMRRHLARGEAEINAQLHPGLRRTARAKRA